jgi:hypothetical protein
MHFLQYLLDRSEIHEAKEITEALIQQKPCNGLKSLLVWICEQTGELERAYTVLKSVNAQTREEKLSVAYCLVRLEKWSEALEILESYVDGGDQKTIAAYILCMSHADPYKAFELLPTIKGSLLYEPVDVAALEHLEKHSLDPKPKKKGKKRKPLPKDFAEDRLPDPGKCY